jgi:hypothetical protein
MMDDDDECGAVGGMRIGRGNRSKVPVLNYDVIKHYTMKAYGGVDVLITFS